jgi:hypothetical protein
LKDFPQTHKEFVELKKYGFNKLHGAFLFEEVFSREVYDSDEEEKVNEDLTLEILGPEKEPEEGEPPAKPREVLYQGLNARASKFEDSVQVNKLLKHDNFIMKRFKFEGPAKPMDIPLPPDDGSEPLPIDEDRKKEEYAMYDKFATEIKSQVDEIGLKKAIYTDHSKKVKE